MLDSQTQPGPDLFESHAAAEAETEIMQTARRFCLLSYKCGRKALITDELPEADALADDLTAAGYDPYVLFVAAIRGEATPDADRLKSLLEKSRARRQKQIERAW